MKSRATVLGLPNILAGILFLIGPLEAQNPGIILQETYDDLGPGSSFTVAFDLNRDGAYEVSFNAPLRGRIDTELHLSDLGPTAQLRALRVTRMTLHSEPVLQLAEMNYAASVHSLGVHMNDGQGSSGSYARVARKFASDAFTWFQPAPNTIFASGTGRAEGPTFQAELLDLSRLEPFVIDLSGEWEWLQFGNATRFRLAYTASPSIRTQVMLPVRVSVVLEQTKPFMAPLPAVTYSNWAAENNLTGAEASIEADPDRDGRPNIDEFAFGLNPSVSDSLPLPLGVEVTNDGAAYVFSRDLSRRGVGYRLQTSADLREWKTIAAALPAAAAHGVGGGVVLAEKSLGGEKYRVTVRDPSLEMTGPQRFARLLLDLK